MIMQRLQNTRSFTFQEITKTTPTRRSAARRAKATSDMSQSRSLGAAATASASTTAIIALTCTASLRSFSISGPNETSDKMNLLHGP